MMAGGAGGQRSSRDAGRLRYCAEGVAENKGTSQPSPFCLRQSPSRIGEPLHPMNWIDSSRGGVPTSRRAKLFRRLPQELHLTLFRQGNRERMARSHN
jgi:hypothetical protein